MEPNDAKRQSDRPRHDDRVTVWCWTCDGTGQVPYPYGHDAKANCGTCSGTGTIRAEPLRPATPAKMVEDWGARHLGLLQSILAELREANGRLRQIERLGKPL